MARKFRNLFQRKTRVVTQVITRTVPAKINPAEYAKVDDVVRGLARQYIAIGREIDDLLGKSHRRDYVNYQLGRMDQIVRTAAMVSGRDPIAVGFDFDHERARDGQGNLIDLGLDESFDSFNIARHRSVASLAS